MFEARLAKDIFNSADFRTTIDSHFQMIYALSFIVAFFYSWWRLPKQYTKYCNRHGIEEFQKGRYQLALDWFNKALKPDVDDPKVLYNIVCSYAQLGDVDTSLVYLDEAIKKGYTNYSKILTDPDLAALREKVNLEDYYEFPEDEEVTNKSI